MRLPTTDLFGRTDVEISYGLAFFEEHVGIGGYDEATEIEYTAKVLEFDLRQRRRHQSRFSYLGYGSQHRMQRPEGTFGLCEPLTVSAVTAFTGKARRRLRQFFS